MITANRLEIRAIDLRLGRYPVVPMRDPSPKEKGPTARDAIDSNWPYMNRTSPEGPKESDRESPGKPPGDASCDPPEPQAGGSKPTATKDQNVVPAQAKGPPSALSR